MSTWRKRISEPQLRMKQALRCDVEQADCACADQRVLLIVAMAAQFGEGVAHDRRALRKSLLRVGDL